MPLPPHPLSARSHPAPGLSFALTLLVLLLSACATPRATPLPPTVPRLTAPATPVGPDALARWRPHFEELARMMETIDEPLILHESADEPFPPALTTRLAPADPLLARFSITPGDDFHFPPIHGPESPFPDHHPLRQIASIRTLRARAAIDAGDLTGAVRLVRANLAQARATLRSQEGIIPLIHANGVGQCALDGVHALARSPRLPPAEARALLAELLADSRLIQIALDRALRGEYAHVYRVIVERMPATDDPDLALSAVASLGMAPPEPLSPGELGLGLSDHVLLDPAATLSAYEADLAPYLASFAHSSRLPRGLHARTTAFTLDNYRRELGAFYDYAGGGSEVSFDLVLRARADMESTPNPIGKLLATYLTPPWELLISSTLRREAQRSALCGLLAWRLHSRPAPWEEIVSAGLLPAPPADPFSDSAALRFSLGDSARVWSVYRNEIDDGGQPVPGNNGQPNDLVWIW